MGREQNRVDGAAAEVEVAEYLESLGFYVDHGVSGFASGIKGFLDIVAVKEELSLGVEVKSIRVYNTRKREHTKNCDGTNYVYAGEKYTGRLVFDVSAVQRETRYCQEMGLYPVVIVLLKPQCRPNLVWYYPWKNVLEKCPGRTSFSLSYFDVLEGGLPAKHYLTFHANDDSDSWYQDLRSYVRKPNKKEMEVKNFE